MKVYRIKHLPTGLYYCPSRQVSVKPPTGGYSRWVKSNLSTKGKLYPRKPSLKNIDGIYNHTEITWSDDGWPTPKFEVIYGWGRKIMDSTTILEIEEVV